MNITPTDKFIIMACVAISIAGVATGLYYFLNWIAGLLL